MTKPMTFGEFLKSKQTDAPITATASKKQAVQHEYIVRSKIVTFIEKGGKVVERAARPDFFFRDRASATGRVTLPEGYYWRDSSEHLARREELESGA